MRDAEEAARAIERWSDTVRRICFLYLKSRDEVEDIFQNVFLKYLLHPAAFQSEEHERAWFIRVSINCCKDTLRARFRKNLSLDALCDGGFDPPDGAQDYSDLYEALQALPQTLRTAVYLFYFERYTAPEIASLLGKNENTVYTWLARARGKLRDALGGEVLE